jgi:hypothetical protein
VGQHAGLMNLVKPPKIIFTKRNMAAFFLMMIPLVIYVGVGYLVNGNADETK